MHAGRTQDTGAEPAGAPTTTCLPRPCTAAWRFLQPTDESPDELPAIAIHSL